MAEKKKRRRRFPLRLILILAILLVLAFLLTADPLFHLNFGIIRTDTTAVSVALLTEVRDIFALNTIEFIYKSVFPHDFIPENIDWGRLLRKRQEGILLSESDLEHLEIYDLCRELGISADRRAYDFVVVTSIVKGGFDLAGTVYENPQSRAEGVSGAVGIDETGAVHLTLPEPVITDFIVEDNSSSSYTYPDMDIDPENWRRLTDFVRSRVEVIVRDMGILEMAEERGERFIERMLKDAGYREVIFRTDRTPLPAYERRS